MRDTERARERKREIVGGEREIMREIERKRIWGARNEYTSKNYIFVTLNFVVN
jgi:hypothetical protein